MNARQTFNPTLTRFRFAILGIAAALNGCGQILAGALTAGQALALTPETEVAIGQQAARDYLLEHPAVASPAVQNAVGVIGKRVAALSTRPQAAYSFTVVKQAEPNAFALPGGPVFVTTGLMTMLRDEAQLAGILGHEAAHVAEHHGINRLREAMVLQGIAVAALGNQPELLQKSAVIALNLVINGRDRTSEMEADRLGLRSMTGAGYDARAVIDTLRAFEAKGDVPGLLVWASDHPTLKDRITAAEAQIAAEGLVGGSRNAEAYGRLLAQLQTAM